MALEGVYEPSPARWVRDQVEEYERSGGERANTLRDTSLPVIIVTTRGNKSGKVRKWPLMRVEHDGEYALVASKGGAPTNPDWYYNLLAHPDVSIELGNEQLPVRARVASGEERNRIWNAQKAAIPTFADYEQSAGGRVIPVVVLDPV